MHATTANRTDCHRRGAHPFIWRFLLGLRRPRHRILGMEFAGEVEPVGAGVTQFAAGDRVFGVKGGANAEYVCVRETGAVAQMPAGARFDELGAVADGACSAISILRQTASRAGGRVAVYGGSGSIGNAAVQVAKHFGAHVTAVCNGKNVELVRSLGADQVIDYEREDFAKKGATYDLVFDAVGNTSFRRVKHALKTDGMYITTDGGFMWHAPLLALVNKRVKLGVARYRQEDVRLLKQLIEAGEYRAVVDRRYPLEDVVEATRYVETGQKTGNVVLTIA